jgi:TAG lipase/steryl ester hydrolase/phospholipase A2/LPA acyltransferase
MTRLAEMFNVNHFIVSQVNPHVIPFIAKDEEMVAAETQQDAATGPSWMSLSASLCKGEVMHRLQQLADTGFLPNLVTKGRSILSQRYSGDINIFPKINYADFPRVLSNPTPEYMLGCMLTGQRATWPKLSRIQNHVAIELALDDTIHKLKGRLVFTPQQDINIRRTSSQDNHLAQRKRAKSTHKTTRFELRMEPPSPILRKSAPTSPLLSRAALRASPQPLYASKQPHNIHNPKHQWTEAGDMDAIQLDPMSSTNDTSDHDYFADPESDTTDRQSSPSPPASPPIHTPTLWPSTPQATMQAQAAPQPAPLSSTQSPLSRRTGTILNLTMTSAARQPSNPNVPSSPELRYKRLFHPPGPATPDVSVGPPVLDVEPVVPINSTRSPSASRPGSRRGSAAGLGMTGLPADLSGTRGMLLRRKNSYM